MSAFTFRLGRLALVRAGIHGIYAGPTKRWRRIVWRIWWLQTAKGVRP